MQIDFYGQLADRLGVRHMDVAQDFRTGEELRRFLCETEIEIADILAHTGTRLVVDDAFTEWGAVLSGAQSIAIIPIVSGG